MKHNKTTRPITRKTTNPFCPSGLLLKYGCVLSNEEFAQHNRFALAVKHLPSMYSCIHTGSGMQRCLEGILRVFYSQGALSDAG